MADAPGPGADAPGPVASLETEADETKNMEAAVEETDPQPKKITVRGVEFTLPAKPPFRAAWEARRIISAKKSGDNSAAGAAMLDVAAAYLGEEQMFEKVLAREMDMEEGFQFASEIVQAVNKAYGMTEGNSSASSNS